MRESTEHVINFMTKIEFAIPLHTYSTVNFQFKALLKKEYRPSRLAMVIMIMNLLLYL